MKRSDIEEIIHILNFLGLTPKEISMLTINDVAVSKECVLIGKKAVLDFQLVYPLLCYSQKRGQSATSCDDPFIPLTYQTIARIIRQLKKSQ
jgi:hypothetical protein